MRLKRSPGNGQLGRWLHKLLFLVVVLPAIAGCSIYGPRQIWSEDTETDIVIYFEGNASNEQIERFWQEVLSIPGPNGQGFELLPGISGVMRTRDVQGHEAVAIEFWTYATRGEREYVMSQIRSSAIVYRVLEDVVPSEVKALD